MPESRRRSGERSTWLRRRGRRQPGGPHAGGYPPSGRTEPDPAWQVPPRVPAGIPGPGGRVGGWLPWPATAGGIGGRPCRRRTVWVHAFMRPAGFGPTPRGGGTPGSRILY